MKALTKHFVEQDVILNLMFLVLQGLIKYPGPISDKMSPEVTFTTPDGESYEINQSVD